MDDINNKFVIRFGLEKNKGSYIVLNQFKEFSRWSDIFKSATKMSFLDATSTILTMCYYYNIKEPTFRIVRIKTTKKVREDRFVAEGAYVFDNNIRNSHGAIASASCENAVAIAKAMNEQDRRTRRKLAKKELEAK